MSKTFEGKPFPKERDQTARFLIIEKIGVNGSKPMKDKRTKRQNNQKKRWNNEAWDDD